MDEFLHLGKLQYNKDNNKHQPSGNSKIQVTQCQDHIEKLMKLTRKTKKINTIIKNNESKQNFKQYIIEKEILHSDHLIMLIVKKYCDLIVNNYQINEDSLKVAIEDHKQLLQFFTKFQIKMISEIYNCEYIDPDLAIKTIFQNANIYHHYLAFITQLHIDEIRVFEQNLKSKEGITIKDLGAKEIFHVPENQEIYHHVIEQLNLIIEAKCPVKKFELIGKLKPIIIKVLIIQFRVQMIIINNNIRLKWIVILFSLSQFTHQSNKISHKYLYMSNLFHLLCLIKLVLYDLIKKLIEGLILGFLLVQLLPQHIFQRKNK
ncbi:hypothetical protein FGO68_gene2294 [Halteria grandinella]|uniref:Uncharacterized protein n=1 Tax=Halteria grandinella TaxID=5974 RepID=A0A8J8NHX7_HALGN|nr:hypothetical protein FGO68_gene2294 [Halteria grandinella]